MWDTARGATLSHDMPCRGCGHAAHRYLPCSEECACVPPPIPGADPDPAHQQLVGASS